MTTPGCCLCAQMAGDASDDLLQEHLGGEYVRRARPVGQQLEIIPSLGALAKGHLLLCPTDHVRSFAELGSSRLAGVEATLGMVAAALSKATGHAVQFFEHGDDPSSDRVSCSVSHAHIHLVPHPIDLAPLAETVVRWEPIGRLADLPKTSNGREYLALRGLKGNWQMAIAPPQGHQSQLLRRLMARSLGRPESWNWRTAPNLPLTESTWELAASLPLAA